VPHALFLQLLLYRLEELDERIPPVRDVRLLVASLLDQCPPDVERVTAPENGTP